jgi:hypothetical protein
MESVEFLTPQQVRSLVEMAERAQEELSRVAGYEVAYDSTTLQLLDEWIDRHLRESSDPSQKMRLLWACFLGEMFRRRHGGEWVLQKHDEGKLLAVLCPTGSGGRYAVDVSGQIDRRIAHGIAQSLTYFYLITSIKLKE